MVPRSGAFQAVDAAQERRLSRAARPDDDEDLAFSTVRATSVRTVVAPNDFREVLDAQDGHQ